MLLPGRTLLAQQPSLEKFAESAAGVEPIERLRSRLLHFDFQGARNVAQVDRGRGTIHVLAAGAAGAHELLLDICFAKPTRGHALEKFAFLLGSHAERGHGGILRDETRVYGTESGVRTGSSESSAGVTVLGVNPVQAMTGKRGYFGNRSSVSCNPHSK